MATISAIIHTKNCAKTLAAALASVSWCDEIVIIDMKSTDGTLDIAKKYTKNIYSVKPMGFADPMRNFGLSKATGDWILVVDADEEVPVTLADKLQEITRQSTDVWEIPRKNILFDRWIQHTGWWPDYQVHFFRAGHARWSDRAHTPPETNGKVGRLPAEERFAKIHHNYDTIEQFIERMNRYTTIQAEQVSRGLSPTAAFADEFSRRFVVDEGFKDGAHGLHLSLLQAFYEVVLRLKQWQGAGFSEEVPQGITEVEQALKTLRYWVATAHIAQSHSVFSTLYWRIRRKLSL